MPDAINEWKQPFVKDTTARTLADALVNADVFLGASVKGLVTPQMLQPMAIAVIGGLLASMVLSLIVTPAVQYYLSRHEQTAA